MKKLIFLFLFLSVSYVGAVPVIPEEFYLRNEILREVGEVAVTSILPNTLRLTLVEGESSEIYADILPENAESTELTWTLPDNAGNVNIYPRGGRCTVYGVSEGEEDIRITAPGGASANVSVKVNKPQEIRTRTFEYEGEKGRAEVFTDTVMQFIIRFLITLAAALLFAVVILTIKRRGRKKR